MFFIIIFLLFSYLLYSLKINSIDNYNTVDSYSWIFLSVITGLFTIIIEYMYYLSLNLSVNSNTIRFSNMIKMYPIKGIIVVAILGPILEELVFRQLIFGTIYDIYCNCNRYVRFTTSLLISGLWFGVMHQVSIFSISIIPYIIFSLFFSLIYVYTKNIKSAILTHIFVNLILIILYDLKW